MDPQGNERQQRFIELAATHAEDFQSRVAQHDRENSFPFENIEAMKASGYTLMTMPEELGGGGASVLDLVLAQERLARGDGPTAVSINMHLQGSGWYADFWRLGEERWRPFLDSLIRDRLIFGGGVSDPRIHTVTGVAGFNETTRRAEKVAGGYRVSGRGGFSTLCACADFLAGSAHYDDAEHGPRCLFFFVPAKSPGIHIQNNWDTMSIRASSSHDIVWENVFVPEENVLDRPARTWDTFNNLFVSWFSPSISACYLGIAQAARDYAVNWISDRTQIPFDRPMNHYPGNQFLAAEMEVGLRAARALLIQTASELSEPTIRINPPLVAIMANQRFVMETAASVVEKAMRMLGGAAIARANPLEQMYRDVRAALIHPLAGHEALGLLGKLVLGIPPDTTPRWV